MSGAFPIEALSPVRRGEGHFYTQIRDQIATAITTHQLPAGTQLPTEADLGERFKASRMTIRVGIQELEAAGLVEPRHGVGVFVRDRPAAQPVPDAATVQQWVHAVDEIVAAAAPEVQEKYQVVREGLPDWARPSS